MSYCSSSRYHIYIFWGDEWDESNIHKSHLFWGENRGSPKNTGFLQSVPLHTITKEKLVQYTELHFANCPIDLDVHPICHPEQWVCRYPGITPQYARKTRCGWHGKHLKKAVARGTQMQHQTKSVSVPHQKRSSHHKKTCPQSDTQGEPSQCVMTEESASGDAYPMISET